MTFSFPLNKRWFFTMVGFHHPQVMGILLLGICSGLPFLLTLGTLHAWLVQAGITKTTIGLFALTTTPYAFKFLWAPVIDHLQLPWLTEWLGQRRGWIFACQGALACSLVGLGMTNPGENIWVTAFFTFCVAFCAATQDSAIEAYRVETLTGPLAGAGASAWMVGFRIGMWIAGGGALYLASFFGWFISYFLMATCVVIGISATLLLPKTSLAFSQRKENKAKEYFVKQSNWSRLKRFFVHQFHTAAIDFFKRHPWGMIGLFIIFYKVGDTILNMTSMPFLIEIGFSTVEIAHIAKSFGLCAVLTGGVLGGFLLVRFSILQNLILCCVLQVISCMMFMVQAYLEYHIHMLILTIGIENLTCGMGTATLIAYFSRLCHPPYTATHYAILSSFASLVRIGLSSLGGWIADHLDWVSFYALTAVACLPCLMFLLWKSGDFSSSASPFSNTKSQK